MYDLETVKEQCRAIVMQVLQLEGTSVVLADTTPFFGTEEHPGVIQDSLAILEIASQLAEVFGLMPSDLGEEAFMNLETLSAKVLEKVQEMEVA